MLVFLTYFSKILHENDIIICLKIGFELSPLTPSKSATGTICQHIILLSCRFLFMYKMCFVKVMKKVMEVKHFRQKKKKKKKKKKIVVVQPKPLSAKKIVVKPWSAL